MARKQAGEPSVPEAARPAYDAIVGLTDRFCQAHLTWEYQMLCRKLAAALARKRPSPLTRGKPEVWACAVLRVIGWVNFLDDSSNSPHMKPAGQTDTHYLGLVVALHTGRGNGRSGGRAGRALQGPESRCAIIFSQGRKESAEAPSRCLNKHARCPRS